MNFKEFSRAGIILPKHIHCQLWGMDVEKDEINQRVISYPNGYFIDVCPDGSYCVDFSNDSFAHDDLLEVEKYFWKHCVEPEYQAENLQIEVETDIKAIFQAHLSANNCSGDIAPEEQQTIDRAVIMVTSVLMNMLDRNTLDG